MSEYKNNNNTINIINTKPIKIAIDTICYQLTNNPDIINIWEKLFIHLESNTKDNTKYEITLLQRTQLNGATYLFKPELNLDKKFKIKQIPYFNYMCMTQDVDILNNICKVGSFDIFISTAFTYCNVIPNIILVNEMNAELNKQPLNHILIQKNKAILNASAFITFINKKAYNDLLSFYPHITKNNIPIEIIIHAVNSSGASTTSTQYKTFDTYLSLLENKLLKPTPFINIIIQSYQETNPERLKELVYCFKQNLQNPYVKMIYDFGSGFGPVSGIEICDAGDTSFSLSFDMDINHNHKYKIVDNPEHKWLTFEMAINYANANTHSDTGDYWCIMNLDIFLDDNSFWNTIRGQLNNGFVYAQSRHEFNKIENKTENKTETKTISKMDENFAKIYHANTQDAWLFKTPLDCNNKNISFDFELGFLGCDNAIAERLYKSGYKVINQPMTYKIFHYDIIKGKTSSNYLEKHTKETKEMTAKMTKPKNKYPERLGSYLVPNYDQLLNGTGGKDIDLIGLINSLGGCSNFERYEFISKLFSDRIIINNP